MSDKLQKVETEVASAPDVSDGIALVLLKKRRLPQALDRCVCGHIYDKHNYSGDPARYEHFYECSGLGRPPSWFLPPQANVCSCEGFLFAELGETVA